MINSLSTSKVTTIHGTLVQTRNEGVLFIGKPGAGKSSAALKHMRAGGSLVADDVVVIERKDRLIFGTAPESLKGVIAVPELGIFDVRDVLGTAYFTDSARIDRCVEMDIPVVGTPCINETEVLGVNLPMSYGEIQSPDEVRELFRDIDSDSVKFSQTRILKAHDALVASAS